MTRLYRRQRQQYVFAAVLGVIGVVNLLFFLILYRPTRSEYYELQESVETLRNEVHSRRLSVERLERLNAQLETSAQDRQSLYTMHFIPHDAGWSEILVQLDRMIQQANVRNTRKSFSIATDPLYGLYSVTINMPVLGTYSNIVNLIKDLEESNTFFIINSIDVRGSAQAVQPGGNDITLALNLETFFYQ
jgi:Tfp pilus assembly protein PilO